MKLKMLNQCFLWRLLNSTDIWLMPSMNPDGFATGKEILWKRNNPLNKYSTILTESPVTETLELRKRLVIWVVWKGREGIESHFIIQCNKCFSIVKSLLVDPGHEGECGGMTGGTPGRENANQIDLNRNFPDQFRDRQVNIKQNFMLLLLWFI